MKSPTSHTATTMLGVVGWGLQPGGPGEGAEVSGSTVCSRTRGGTLGRRGHWRERNVLVWVWKVQQGSGAEQRIPGKWPVQLGAAGPWALTQTRAGGTVGGQGGQLHGHALCRPPVCRCLSLCSSLSPHLSFIAFFLPLTMGNTPLKMFWQGCMYF